MSNPRVLFALLFATVVAIFAPLFYIGLNWSNLDKHWLVWCADLLIKINHAIWQSGGVILLLLLSISIFRVLLFLLASWSKAKKVNARLKIERTALPKKIIASANRACLDTSYIRAITNNEPEIFCFGWWNPVIVVSTKVGDIFSVDEAAAALAHEEHHRRRRHSLKLLISQALAEGIWFLPLAGDLVAYLAYRVEVEADRFASSQSLTQPLRNALARFLQNPAPSWQVAFASGPAHDRVEALLTGQAKPFRPHVVATLQSIIIITILSICLIWLATPAKSNSFAPTLIGNMSIVHGHCAPPLYTPVDR